MGKAELRCICGAPVAEEYPEDLRGGRGTHADTYDDCPVYVRCDQVHCRAKQSPETLDEWIAAAEHWRTHAYLSGCSHGR